jgi:hypothetical protein
MGELAALLGSAPERFSFTGADVPVAARDLDCEALFENFLLDRALDAVRRRRRSVPEDEYKQMVAAWEQDAATGAYAWGSEAAADAVSRIGSPGWRHLAYLQIKRADPAADRHFIDEVCKDPGAARELDAAMARASDPLARRHNGASPPAPSAPS